MSLKIGVIGIGSAGNQVANAAALKNFRAVAINSSKKDLDAVNENCTTILVGAEGGCGKERSMAIRLVKENYVDILRKIDGMFDDMDIVYVAGSTSGGTGSGMMPILTEILSSKFKSQRFSNILMMPNETESIPAIKNAIDCVNDLRKYNLPFMMYDNTRYKGSKNISDLFKAVNSEIVQDMCIIRGDYTERVTDLQQIDDKDMLKLATTPGLLRISKTSEIIENDLDEKSIGDYIIDSIKGSLSVDIDRDRIVQRMGFIINISNTLLARMDNTYSAIKEYAGIPKGGIFEDISIAKQGELSYIITILSGLSYPETKMSRMAAIVNSLKDNVTIKKESKFDDIRNSLDWLDSDEPTPMYKKTSSKEKDTDDLSAVFKKY